MRETRAAESNALSYLEELDQLRAQFQPTEKVPKKVRVAFDLAKPIKIKEQYKHVTFDQVRLIHYLRHMHVAAQDKVWMSWRGIGRILKLSHMTCRYALRKYQKQQFQFADQRKFNGTTRVNKITAEVKGFLLSHQVLKDWSGLTLAQRCQQLRLDREVSIKPCSLRAFYKKNKVGYYVANYQYQQAISRPQWKVQEFTVALAKLIKE